MRKWAGLAVLAMPCMLVSMDANVLNLAIPQLAAELHPSSSQLLWVVDGYPFVVAGLLLPMGVVADRIGPRRVLLTGAGVFGAASVLAALSGHAGLLIAARVLLGAAGATLMPATLALIRHMFVDDGQRRIALGVWTASFAVGGLVGPLVGGLLLGRFWWGSVFLVAVPPMVLLLALGPFLLPEIRRTGRSRVDAWSVMLSLGAVFGVVYGLKRIAENGVQVRPVLAVAVGLVLGVAFVHRQRRPDPALDLAMFRTPGFSVPLVVNGLAFFALYGTQLISAQYAQLVLGLSPLEAGLLTVPGTLAFLLASAGAPLLANRLTPARAMTGSLLLTASGFGFLTQIQLDSAVLLVTGSVVFSLGLAVVYFLAADLTVAAAPPNLAGSSAAILESGAELGGAFGIALMGSLVNVVYRETTADAPTGSTLTAAAATAERLPDVAGAELLTTARAAFVQGFRIAEIAATILLVMAALVAAMTLSRRSQAGETCQVLLGERNSADSHCDEHPTQ